jgi:hypothetical protein
MVDVIFLVFTFSFLVLRKQPNGLRGLAPHTPAGGLALGRAWTLPGSRKNSQPACYLHRWVARGVPTGQGKTLENRILLRDSRSCQGLPARQLHRQLRVAHTAVNWQARLFSYIFSCPGLSRILSNF